MPNKSEFVWGGGHLPNDIRTYYSTLAQKEITFYQSSFATLA